jgi:hypothetical protein
MISPDLREMMGLGGGEHSTEEPSGSMLKGEISFEKKRRSIVAAPLL